MQLEVVSVFISLAKQFRQRKAKYVAYGLLSGYACAWVGHFVFEKNKPASFKQPLYSLFLTGVCFPILYVAI